MTMSAPPACRRRRRSHRRWPTEDAPTRVGRPWGAIFGVGWLLLILLLTLFGDRLAVRASADRGRRPRRPNYGSGPEPTTSGSAATDSVATSSPACVAGARISLLISVTSIVIGAAARHRTRHDLRLLPRLDRPGRVDLRRQPARVPGDHPRRTGRRADEGAVDERHRVLRHRVHLGHQHVGDHRRVRPAVDRPDHPHRAGPDDEPHASASTCWRPAAWAPAPAAILLREILPNVVPALVSVLFTGVAILLAAEAGLAFLGYSVEAPAASWGLMVAENREFIETAWWATVFPCLMLFLTVLSFNLIGDHIARRFDIREAAL